MSHLGKNTATIQNTSGGQVTVHGKRLQDQEEYTLSRREVSEWDDDIHFEGLVTSGTLTILNNTNGKFWKKSTAESTTTNTAYQRKVRLNMNITTSGTYRMGWTGTISSSANNQEVACRVQLNDVTPNLDVQQSKGKDIVSIGGFHYQVLTSGSHTLDLDWKAVAGGTAKIEKARLEYWAESIETEEI